MTRSKRVSKRARRAANLLKGGRVRRSAVGASPGTVNVDPQGHPSSVHVMAFGPDDLAELKPGTPQEVEPLRSQHSLLWVNVDGLGTAEVLHELSRMFDLHQLAMEDVVNVGQRSKVEDYDNCQFVVLRMADPQHGPVTEQVSLFFGEGFLISFQERPGDCLEPVRKRVRQGKPRIRAGQADYLAYAVIDAVVDGYYPILDHYADRLLDMEERLLTQKQAVSLSRLYDLKRELMSLRKDILPLREAVGALLRSESTLISDNTRWYLRDAHDHAEQIADAVEHHRDTAAGLIELFRSNEQARLNEVMKVLTVTATIFIPLSFIAGVYGMNFNPDISPLNMPELSWYWGYPFAVTLMLAVALIMLGYFRRKGWIGGGGDNEKPEDRR